MTNSTYLPTLVQNRMDRVEDETGIPATLTRPAPGTFQLDHGTDRVHLMCRWTRNTRGKFTYTSHLTVDGETRDWVNNEQAYARLLNNPDDRHPDRRPGAALPPVHPLSDGEEPPPLVQGIVNQARQASPQTVNALHIGHAAMSHRTRRGAYTFPPADGDEQPDPHGYVLQVDKPDGSRVQLYFHPHPDSPATLYPSGLAAVDDQDRDMTAEYDHDIEAALENILGMRMPGPGASPGPARKRPDTTGAVTNSVTVRRTTVIRV